MEASDALSHSPPERSRPAGLAWRRPATFEWSSGTLERLQSGVGRITALVPVPWSRGGSPTAAYAPEFSEQSPCCRRTPSNNARIVSNRLSFQDDSLFRGTSLANVLKGCARILGEEPCTSEAYELSELVDADRHLDAFISHNWATPRSDKFLALALHFNFFLAWSSALVVSLICFALQLWGVLPVSHAVVSHHTTFQSLWCQVAGTVTFILALIFGRQILGTFGFGGPVVFLDKTCVHQTDEDLKRKGIENLAAFLSSSSSAVVLYSDLYLRKLWTVYELATFLLLFPDSQQLLVQPVFLPKVILLSMLIIFASRLLYGIMYMPVVHRFLRDHFPSAVGDIFEFWMVPQLLILAPSVMCLVIVLRRWIQERRHIYKHIQAFSILDADCFSEKDRRVVEGNVAVFARHFGLVEPQATREEALSAFDELVHKRVPGVLHKSLGRIGVRYKHTCLIFIVYIFYIMDTLACRMIIGKDDARLLIIDTFGYATVVFCIGPVSIGICSRFSELSLILQGEFRWLGIVLTNAATLFTYYVLWMINIKLVDLTYNEWFLGIPAYLVFVVLMVVIATWMYRFAPMIAEEAVRSESSSDDSADEYEDEEDGEETR
eukprot:TRINITY_DN17716_c0_g1_i1.p1 TRINITY_DN17716_c0_g1~~TRINITY_DN17716_c0_g1_i1.p1  ORF type:complete len:606 (-),score=116.04 TRINITY_DN17716_c0_g1_i1:75-1892(-)